MKKNSNKLVPFLIGFLIASFVSPMHAVSAADKIKDFRATNQKAALLGLFSEFVEPPVEEKWANQIRKSINRYSRSYGQSSIQGFNLGTNPQKQFFKPAVNLEEPQKKFLQATGKDNSIDLIILGTLRENGDQFELELQLFDNRIETMSGIEKVSFTNTTGVTAVESAVFKLMNYIDRDGFVHPQPQNFLESPEAMKSAEVNAEAANAAQKSEFSVNPNDLGNGLLAGQETVGGEKTPFWETWWFWTIIGGGLAVGGSLAYYFLVVDQPTTKANVTFQHQ